MKHSARHWSLGLTELFVSYELGQTFERVRDSAAPREACGAFLVEPVGPGYMHRGRVEHFEQLPNRHPHPEHGFELDPLTFVDYCYRTLELARPGFADGRYADSFDFPLVGLFHTHPSSPPTPSRADRDAAAAIHAIGWLAFPWIIAGAGAVTDDALAAFWMPGARELRFA